MKYLNIGKNITVSLAIPHKIKVIVPVPFWMNLDVGMDMLPALVRKNYRYLSVAILRKNVKEYSAVSLCKAVQQLVIQGCSELTTEHKLFMFNSSR